MKKLAENIKVLLWRLTKGNLIHIQYRKTAKERERMHNILTSEETVQYIIDHKCSVARFGDGEFQMIEHGMKGGNSDNFTVDSFQQYDDVLSRRLLEVLNSEGDNLLVCIPYSFKDSRTYKGYNRLFFEREWLGRSKWIAPIILRHKLLGDSTFSRFYLNRIDINDYPGYINLLKGIWDKEDVIIIEGSLSRLGIGNDLFSNAKSIRRIICPPKNAFAAYDKILSAAIKQSPNALFLLALGHTATVLAYDLAIAGRRAIDLGHIDIEYEWFRMKAKKKVPVQGKYVNESKEGRITCETSFDEDYTSQIITNLSDNVH